MRVRFLIAVLFMAFMVSGLYAQSIDEIKIDEAHYHWGEGIGKSQREAKDNALHDLSSKISLHVSSTDIGYISNEQRNQDVDTYVSFERKMQTYSTVTLTDCHSKVVSTGKSFKVFTYIEREKVDKMFEDREKVMQANVQIANEAFRCLNLADALRYYYTSYLLTQSLRYRADAVVEDENGNKQMAILLKVRGRASAGHGKPSTFALKIANGVGVFP